MKFILICALAASVAVPSPAAAKGNMRTVLFFGDSLTAGFGIDPSDAYPALIQKEIDKLGWKFRVVNAGVSGETTAGGAERLAWTLKQEADVLVLALGGNDGLRGVPPGTTKKNLQRMIDTARQVKPGITIVLAGVKMPANYGEAYTDRFFAIFGELAKENRLPLIPFILEGVGGVPRLNLPDRVHPTEEGHKVMAATVWKTLKPVLSGMKASQ